MYNRYVRNDNGEYQRIPVSDPPPPPPPEHDSFHPFSTGGGPCYGNGPQYGSGGPQYGGGSPPPPPPKGGGRKGFLSGILDRLNLKNIDTGDLLLILILLLLFQDGEDEEMLIALGLMLIL